MKTDIERKLRSFWIAPDYSETEIKFEEVITIPLSGDKDPLVRTVPYSVAPPYRPSKQLIECVKKLRAHALAIFELDVEPKKLHLYSVSGFLIKGDLLTQTSRVELILNKLVERTEKNVPIKLPQVTMYGQSEYVDCDKMSKIIEDLIEEIWAYLGGNVDADYVDGADTTQLALFPQMSLKVPETHFTK